VTRSILIRGGRLIDPSQKVDRKGDLLLDGGKVAAFGKMPAGMRADETIDATGKVVCPGLIDMHVHLREPGKEEEETIASGSAAAIAGGFTTVAAMPNTEPACDSEAQVEWTILAGKRAGLANVLPIGAVSRGRRGSELAEIGQMVRGGAVAFSDDGAPVHNAALMRLALEYSKMFDKPVIQHSEDPNLFGCGCMHEGRVSMELGLEGIPAAAEESMAARDCLLAEITGGNLHVAHISTRGTAEAVRRGKKAGVRVTCEVTPHHFTLTDERVRSYDAVYKMNPPLREGPDVKAMILGLQDGTIDVIATDHAPHAPEEKELEFAEAPFGVIGLESALGLVMTFLVEKGHLTLPRALAAMTTNPARILRLEGKGTLRPGADADVTVFDPAAAWTVDAQKFRSRSRNCPFHGWKLTGRPEWVVVGGRVLRSGPDA
jgi:dihydroorotase